MAINVDVRIQRLVPNENPNATVLVILDNVEGGVVINDEYKDQNIFRIKSVEDLMKYFSIEAGKQELLEMIYLIQAGMQIVAIQPEAGQNKLTEDEVEKLAEDYEYSFIAYANKIFNSFDGLDEGIIDLVNKVDAELFLQVETDFDTSLKINLKNPKISLFANTGTVAMPTTYGELNLTDEMKNNGIPVSLAVLVRKSKLILEKEPWTPVAGYTSGRLTEFTNLNKQIGNIQRRKLQAAGINPAVLKAGVGVVVVAQNTTKFIDEENNPLAKGHVTTLTLDFKKKLKALAEETLHKLNNAKTWTLVKLQVRSIFNPVLEAGAIEEFNVRVGLNETMTEEDVRNGKLILQTSFKPTYAIEEINVIVTIIEDDEGFLIETDGGL